MNIDLIISGTYVLDIVLVLLFILLLRSLMLLASSREDK